MERLGPDNQGGFNWTVTFTSDNQDGDLPLLTVETDALTGDDTLVEVISVEDGSYIDGYVNATLGGNSTLIQANATAEEVRVALEAIGTGSIAVSREGALASLTVLGMMEVDGPTNSDRYKHIYTSFLYGCARRFPVYASGSLLFRAHTRARVCLL